MPTDPTLPADALPQPSSAQSHAPVPFDTREEQVHARLARARTAHPDHPLLADLEWLAGQHLGLVRRIDKIARISDRLQAEVLGTNKLLHARASLDALTGLGNRSALMLQLQQCQERLRGPVGHGRYYGLLMIDLDRFKTINDRLGHAAGDQALLLAADTLRSHTRASDVCVRWGGDEFVVLIGDCNPLGLEAVAAKLVRGFAALELSVGGERHPFAASIGCHLGSLAETAEQSLERADAALYRAKSAGRGCYVYFRDGLTQSVHLGDGTRPLASAPTIDAVLRPPVPGAPAKRARRGTAKPTAGSTTATQAPATSASDSRRRARPRRMPHP